VDREGENKMKKSFKVYMVLENGSEQHLYNCRTQEQAERKCEKCYREDAYERSIGYYVPNTKYIVK